VASERRTMRISRRKIMLFFARGKAGSAPPAPPSRGPRAVGCGGGHPGEPQAGGIAASIAGRDHRGLARPAASRLGATGGNRRFYGRASGNSEKVEF